jgi:hypothetical protein
MMRLASATSAFSHLALIAAAERFILAERLENYR